MKRKLITLCSLMLALAGVHLHAVPLGTGFTYQGRLADGANPAHGRYDLQWAVYDAAALGNRIGNIVTNTAVAVNNGLFSVNLDFGANIFTGNACWLAMGVRSNGVVANFTLLNPRQPMTPAPQALHALTAGTVTEGSVMASQFKTTGAPSAGQILTYNGASLVWQTPGGPNLWSVNGNNAYYNGGNVGIGTSAPSGKLTVMTADDTTPTFITAFDGRHALIGTASEGVGLSYSASTGAGYISALAPGIAWKDLVLQANTFRFTPSGITAFSVANNGDLSYAGQLNKLDVADNFTAIVRCGDFNMGWSGRRGTPGRALSDLGSGLWLNGGNDWANTHIGGGIVSYAGQLNKLDVADNFTAVVRCGDFNMGWSGRRGTPGRALSDLGNALWVNGGNDWANTFIGGANVSVCTLTIRGGCDLAEPFPMKEEKIEKGSVVVIDEEHSGRLKLSTHAYDTQVAGIVSGANGVNPGIALHQEGVIEGGQNVALTGRVYVQADASSRPIKPGDLLTTSNTPGHAMKVTDHAKAQGAIIGKAMSSLQEGKGMVLVLVSLQ